MENLFLTATADSVPESAYKGLLLAAKFDKYEAVDTLDAVL